MCRQCAMYKAGPMGPFGVAVSLRSVWFGSGYWRSRDSTPCGNLVGLGHHRRTGLLQDLGARQVGGFCREVGVLNARARC